MLITLKLLPRFPHRVPVGPGILPSAFFHIMTHNRLQTVKILLMVSAGKLPRMTGAPISLAVTLSAFSSFISEGANPLPNDQSLALQILTGNLTVHFMISSRVAFPKILPDVLSFLRRSCFFTAPYSIDAFQFHPTSLPK
jgi:hypothetical protein